MKKIVSLLLALVMLLPVLALAETIAEPAVYTFDFGAFTIDLAETDYYQVADEMVSNQLYLQVYPAYDDAAVTHPNFNIVWSAEDPSTALSLYGAELYAKLIQQSAQQQYKEMGIVMTDLQVLSATFEDDVAAMLTCANLDYTGMGVDLVSPTYQLQMYLCMGEEGCYIVTFTADTLEGVQAMIPYLETIEMKE